MNSRTGVAISEEVGLRASPKLMSLLGSDPASFKGAVLKYHEDRPSTPLANRAWIAEQRCGSR